MNKKSKNKPTYEELEKEVSLLREQNQMLQKRLDNYPPIKKNIQGPKNSLIELEGIINTSPVGLGIARNRRIVYVNEQLSSMTGYTKEELTDKHVSELYTNEEEFKKAGDIISQITSSEDIRRFESRWIKKDKSIIDILISVTSFHTQPENQNEVIFVILDITESKKNERERDRIFNYSLDMICIAGFDGYLKTLNPSWSTILGWTDKELTSRPWLDFMHPDDKEATLNAKQNLDNGVSVYLFENRYKCKDGTYKWLAWNSYPIQEENLIFAVARDISKTKEIEIELATKNKELQLAEKEIKKHNEELRTINEELEQKNKEHEKINAQLQFSTQLIESILNAIPDIIGLQDTEHKIIRYNEAGYNFFGLTADDIKGKRCFEIVGKKKPCFPCATSITYNTKKPAAIERYEESLDMWFDVRAYPILDEKGNITHVVEHLRDITKEKQVEAELRQKNELHKKLNNLLKEKNRKFEDLLQQLSESEEKFRAAFKTSPDSLHICRLSDGQFIEINKGFTDFSGYNQEDIAQKTCQELGLWEDKGNLDEFNRHLDEKGRVENQKAKFRTKNGELKYGLISATKIDLQSESHILTIIKDITSLIKTQQDLIEAKERAEEADQLKTAFLANISHEIRTPMNGIIGFSQLLDNENLSSDERKQFISIINKSSEQLLRIIDDIIDISKIEANQLRIYQNECKLNTLISELEVVFNKNKEFSGKGHLEIKTHYGLESGFDKVLTDESRIRQILNNLIWNAVKYTDEGYINIGYKYLENETTPYLRFFVEDTGIGIPKDSLNNIFNRFHQGDLTLKNKLGGTGLGLTISKGLVELLQGDMWVESEPGKGSVFYFTIPYTVSGAKPQSAETDIISRELSLHSKNILIVEDDKVNAEYLKVILSAKGAKVLFAYSGNDAVSICKKRNDIDIVLMDIQLPGLDGFKATQTIRKFNAEIPIIAQTAYAMTEDKIKSLQSGCNDYIPKPISKNVLLKTINKYI